MSYVADFDPTGFDPAAPATWPMPATEYVPGSWWYVTTGGVVGGVAVHRGDRLYPIGVGRRYGELGYGDATYGGDPPPPPWDADALRVEWRVVSTSAPAWDTPPPPYAGCELLDGWRIVVEALYNGDDQTRTYGSGTYGSSVYGSENGLGEQWHDVTHESFGVVSRRGVSDGSPVSDVEELSVDFLDFDASIFPLNTAPNTPDGILRSPSVATPIRVSVLDRGGNPYPIFSGRIDAIGDEHSRESRAIAVTGYGFGVDLATTITSYGRPAEPVEDRIGNLLDRAGWKWGRATPLAGATLRRIDEVDQANIRSELDRASLSSSMMTSTDRWGRIESRPWPLVGSGTVLEVTDRKGGSALPSSSLEYVADREELLNVASATTEEVQGAAEIVVERLSPSRGRYGRSSEVLGFPASGLSAQRADLEALADAAIARYSRIVTRCASVEADTSLDPRWLKILANLDIGQAVRTIRTEPTPLVLDHVLVGIEHRLVRGRWSATLLLSTVTPTI